MELALQSAVGAVGVEVVQGPWRRCPSRRRVAAQVLAVLVVLQAGAGCAPRLHFGPAPARPVEPVAACLWAEGLTLVRGSGSYYLYNTTSVTPMSTVGVYRPPTVNAGSNLTGGGAGVAFYRGAERLDVATGLRLLGQPELEAEQARTLERFSGGRHVLWSRPLWIALMAGGLAATLASAGPALQKQPDLGRVLALTGGGLGGMLLSVPFMYLDMTRREPAGQHTLRQQLVVDEGDRVARLGRAVDAFNEVVRRRCALRGR